MYSTRLDTSGDSDNASSEGSDSDGFPKNPFSTDSGEDDKVIKCGKCQAEFSKVGNLNRHIRMKRCKALKER
jgi:hypothetical protein